MPKFRYVKRSQIWAPGNNPRKNIPEEAIAERRESIRQVGILHPLIVTEEPNRHDGTPYKLNAGFIRYFASEGVLDDIPVMIRDAGGASMTEVALIENIQRTDMAPIDEAAAIVELMGEHGLSITKVAGRLGKSEGWVNKRLALVRTDSDIQEVAAVKPKAMSSLLEIQKVRDQDLREDLLEKVLHKTPHKEIKSAVDEYLSAHIPAPSFPDPETARRAQANAETGGGNVSRGERVTGGPSKREADEEVKRAIANLEAWTEHCSDRQFKKLQEFARRVLRGDLSR